jgi:hypothetical protein
MKKITAILLTAALLLTLQLSATALDMHIPQAYSSEGALIILRHAAGIAPLTGSDLEKYDVNNDGVVDTEDALSVLRVVAGIGESERQNSVRWESNLGYYFALNLFTDKSVYKTTDIINIWANFEFFGGGTDTLKIFHGDPYLSFTVYDGETYWSSGMIIDVMMSTVIEKGAVYRFDHVKSGGWSASAPDADFWREFFTGSPDFRLPAGEYFVQAYAEFSTSDENFLDYRTRLSTGLRIVVED